MKIQKVSIYYPPARKNNKYPLITQNRQFKFTKSLESAVARKTRLDVMIETCDSVVGINAGDLLEQREKAEAHVEKIRHELLVMFEKK